MKNLTDKEFEAEKDKVIHESRLTIKKLLQFPKDGEVQKDALDTLHYILDVEFETTRRTLGHLVDMEKKGQI